MAHPEVTPAILLFLLNDPEHRRDTTLASRSEFRVEVRLIVPVSDVDALVSGNRVRVDGLRRGNTVLPFLLHLCMHHQQRVVGEMNGDLTLGIPISCVSLIVLGYCHVMVSDSTS